MFGKFILRLESPGHVYAFLRIFFLLNSFLRIFFSFLPNVPEHVKRHPAKDLLYFLSISLALLFHHSSMLRPPEAME
jgi:hypothetical protein